jgi:hypothetical protein
VLHATTKIIGSYSTITTGKDNGRTIATPTINAEPLLTPSSPGSAIGLRKSPCMIGPAVASAAPTILYTARDPKVLKFLRANVGRAVTGEELRYVAGNKTEWARRVRELRTEHGWPVATKTTGRSDLAVGVYILQADRQSAEHDRHIKDDVRREVLRRDGYTCKGCGWSHKEWNPADPRHLELHHVTHHARGGQNIKENLRALCNVCHDRAHRTERGNADK